MPPARGEAIDQYRTVRTRNIGRTSARVAGSGSTVRINARSAVSSIAPRASRFTVASGLALPRVHELTALGWRCCAACCAARADLAVLRWLLRDGRAAFGGWCGGCGVPWAQASGECPPQWGTFLGVILGLRRGLGRLRSGRFGLRRRCRGIAGRRCRWRCRRCRSRGRCLARRHRLRLHVGIPSLGVAAVQRDWGRGVSLTEPHQHDLSVSVQRRERLSPHLSKRLHCITMHLYDATNGVTGREHSAQA